MKAEDLKADISDERTYFALERPVDPKLLAGALTFHVGQSRPVVLDVSEGARESVDAAIALAGEWFGARGVDIRATMSRVGEPYQPPTRFAWTVAIVPMAHDTPRDESPAEHIARLERENAKLRKRLDQTRAGLLDLIERIDSALAAFNAETKGGEL